MAHGWGWKLVSSLQAATAKGTRKGHWLGGNNSRRASEGSRLPSAFRKMCLKEDLHRCQNWPLFTISSCRIWLRRMSTSSAVTAGRPPSWSTCAYKVKPKGSLAEAREHVALFGDEPGHTHTHKHTDSDTQTQSLSAKTSISLNPKMYTSIRCWCHTINNKQNQ